MSMSVVCVMGGASYQVGRGKHRAESSFRNRRNIACRSLTSVSGTGNCVDVLDPVRQPILASGLPAVLAPEHPPATRDTAEPRGVRGMLAHHHQSRLRLDPVINAPPCRAEVLAAVQFQSKSGRQFRSISAGVASARGLNHQLMIRAFRSGRDLFPVPAAPAVGPFRVVVSRSAFRRKGQKADISPMTTFGR
jgi:hypothetical protein